MHTYRFNISLEDNDDFYFDVDITPANTFLDFHNIIQSVLQFSGTELASFYMSNNLWKKKAEITLMDMRLDEDVDLYEDDDENKPKKKKVLLMSDTKLVKIIEDPHQRFIYVYDFLTPWTLYIELTKIIDADKNVKYPICSKIFGELPTKKANITLKNTLTDTDVIEELDDIAPEDDFTEEDNFNDLESGENGLGEGFDELKF